MLEFLFAAYLLVSLFTIIEAACHGEAVPVAAVFGTLWPIVGLIFIYIRHIKQQPAEAEDPPESPRVFGFHPPAESPRSTRHACRERR